MRWQRSYCCHYKCIRSRWEENIRSCEARAELPRRQGMAEYLRRGKTSALQNARKIHIPHPMFTRVFDTARRIFSRSPSAQELPHEARESTPRSHNEETDMVVATRRGPVDSTPQSSTRKSKRTLETEDTRYTEEDVIR
jgi:hypothetical protein